jgi:hypothetical protein
MLFFMGAILASAFAHRMRLRRKLNHPGAVILNYKKFAAAAISAVLLATNAQASVVSSTAVADDWFGNTNPADFTSFTVSGTPGDEFLRTFGADGTATRSALEFSLAGIAAGATVNSATFTIKSRGQTSVGGGTFSFWGYTGDGAITAADALETSNFLTTALTLDVDATFVVDVTALIQSLVNSASQYAGILITVSPEGSFFGADFLSSEGDVVLNLPASDRPDLTVDFSPNQTVPEAGTLALLSFALAGLAASRRRRRA